MTYGGGGRITMTKNAETKQEQDNAADTEGQARMMRGQHDWRPCSSAVRAAGAMTMTSVPQWERQLRLACVDHEDREELGRLRLAGIGADAVAVAGHLGEALPGLVDRHRPVIDLAADRPLEHGRVDEGGFGMQVAGRVAARTVFDEHALDALAGRVRQLVLIDESRLGAL